MDGMTTDALENWCLVFMWIAGTGAAAAVMAAFVNWRIALAALAFACLGVGGVAFALPRLEAREASAKEYAGLREAVADDPTLAGPASAALTDRRLTVREASDLGERYRRTLEMRRSTEHARTKAEALAALR